MCRWIRLFPARSNDAHKQLLWWAMSSDTKGNCRLTLACDRGGFADFRKLLEKYAKQEAVMVVGHNPNLSQFLGSVISDSGCEASVDLKKGAVAEVEMRRTSGTLQSEEHTSEL